MQFIDLKKQYKLIESDVLGSIQAVLEPEWFSILAPRSPKSAGYLQELLSASQV